MKLRTNFTIKDPYDAIRYTEGEKRKIAANLHDTTLQHMAVIVHQLELIKMYIDTDPVQAKLEVADLLNKFISEIEEIRSHIDFLRPVVFDDLSLKSILDQKITAMSNDFPINFHLSIEDIQLDILEDKITLFRILQEIVNNAIKHSKCGNININLYTSNGYIYINVEDDGVGFDTDIRYSNKGEHYGLLGVKDRVELVSGTIKFDSVINKGTKVLIEIPYDD